MKMIPGACYLGEDAAQDRKYSTAQEANKESAIVVVEGKS